MTHLYRKLVAASSALLCIAGFTNMGVARDQDAQSPSTDTTADARRANQLKEAARMAQERINASDAERKALRSATGPGEIKEILMRNGIAAEQLQGVAIARKAKAAAGERGKAGRVKITTSCCPLQIIIAA